MPVSELPKSLHRLQSLQTFDFRITKYSALATEVRNGRGKVPVANYKVVKYVDEENTGSATSSREISRSCYSFCMCPGGQIPRDDTYESTSLDGLYPIGEGASYAGGIVSAVVDDMYVSFVVAKDLGLYEGDVVSFGKGLKEHQICEVLSFLPHPRMNHQPT
ncbi:hypothetical protein GIB67_002044 [Kingdonia uniflora]|uniref:FAD-dependent protein C-terminal domain-containing protein n=1 Tax=Kingdonia uniflora TaxID=39325 RepID=A0A7J7KW99_9MAGN|nr:hypothetical protein GIB67_002044 [Kingdonia uniflora]